VTTAAAAPVLINISRSKAVTQAPSIQLARHAVETVALQRQVAQLTASSAALVLPVLPASTCMGSVTGVSGRAGNAVRALQLTPLQFANLHTVWTS